jgi:RND superfamily putative drug exporter
VLAVTDPFNKNVTGMVSDDGQAALIRLQFEGTVTNVPAATKTALQDMATSLGALPAGSTVVVGGDLFSTSLPSLSVTEIIGVLVALFVLIVTFRSLAVAWFPLVSAIIGVILSVVLIFASTAFATVSSTTPMLAIMLGLAVGIDYALFIVARHQDQVRAGIDPEESAARATGTAGSAVMFAGVTVLIALVGLGFAGIPFLTTMGLAAAGASPSPSRSPSPSPRPSSASRRAASPGGRGVWGAASRSGAVAARRARGDAEDSAAPVASAASSKKTNPWVALVTRHPVVSALSVILVLGVAAIPASSLQLAPAERRHAAGVQRGATGLRPDRRALRARRERAAHPHRHDRHLDRPADAHGRPEGRRREDPGVKTVALATPNQTADTGLVQIVPTTAPDAPQTADLVRSCVPTTTNGCRSTASTSRSPASRRSRSTSPTAWAPPWCRSACSSSACRSSC